MEYTIFGRTELKVSRTSFGAIPIQRIPYEESTKILKHAYENGITLYDTANSYTTSEDRIGTALFDVRKNIIICTKSGAETPKVLMENLENSLQKLRTDYIDVFQFHVPGFVPLPGGSDGLYDTVKKAQQDGKIRFIGITCHKLNIAYEAVDSSFYDTVQYPFSYISTKNEMKLASYCDKKNIGLLGMKGLCGGILSNARAAFAFLRQYKNIVPIWGIEKLYELEEFLQYENEPPELDEILLKEINKDKEEFSSSFCRACGYCLPCPAGIPIPMAARMKFLLGRMLRDTFVTPFWQDNMKKISDCTGCGRCKANCPYELDVPVLLKEHQDYFFRSL